MKNKKKNLIIGAGLAGLSTAFHLKKDYILFEKEKDVGGTARSANFKNFVFDYAGHAFHSRNSYTLKLMKRLLKDNLFKQKRKSGIFLKARLSPILFR